MKIFVVFFFCFSFFLLNSCRKENDSGLKDIPTSEYIPPGWTLYSTGHASNLITLDNTENLWISGGKTLVKRSGNSNEDYTAFISSYINTNSFILSIKFDNINNLWIGLGNTISDSSITELLMYDGTNYYSYNRLNSGLNDNRVTSIAVDGMNTKWIGTNGSLVKYDGNSWNVYDSLNSPLKEFSPVICTSGYTWIGGHNSLTRFDGTTFISWNSSHSSFPSTGIRIMEKDNSGNIWFVGYAPSLLYVSTTLWKFDGSSFTS